MFGAVAYPTGPYSLHPGESTLLDLSGSVVVMKPCRINGKIFEWVLISRRSCFRAGVRYYIRGNGSTCWLRETQGTSLWGKSG